MPKYSERDLKKLFGLSGGICAFPGCSEDIVCRDTNDIVGQIAHIVANSDEGPRADPAMPVSARDSYENLMLLCRNHHAQIDSPTGASKWTRDKLLGMKREREQWVAQRLLIGVAHPFNVSQLSYLNVPRLAALAFLNGQEVDLTFGDGLTLLIDGGLLGAQLIYRFGDVLKGINLRSVAVDSTFSSDPSLVGVTAAFDASFRTKNLPTIERARQGTAWMKGSLDKDPHVYLKFERGRFILPIDPKWILTTTGWSDFRASGRHTRLAGACTIKSIDSKSGTVVGTPLFIGTPRSQFDNWWESSKS